MSSRNAAADLVRAGKLEDAEAAAQDLLERFPEVHDGSDRLGMVHEAHGEKKQAADCYRKALEIIRAQPENYDPVFADAFVQLINRLEHRSLARPPDRHCLRSEGELNPTSCVGLRSWRPLSSCIPDRTGRQRLDSLGLQQGPPDERTRPYRDRMSLHECVILGRKPEIG